MSGNERGARWCHKCLPSGALCTMWGIQIQAQPRCMGDALSRAQPVPSDDWMKIVIGTMIDGTRKCEDVIQVNEGLDFITFNSLTGCSRNDFGGQSSRAKTVLDSQPMSKSANHARSL